MADSSVQDHLPPPNIATQIVVQEKLVGGSWNELLLLLEHPCFTLSTLFQILNNHFQWIALGTNGGHGHRVQNHAARAPGHVPGPKMDHLMVVNNAMDHQPPPNHATLIVVQL